jgi:hypothetical protein
MKDKTFYGFNRELSDRKPSAAINPLPVSRLA